MFMGRFAGVQSLPAVQREGSRAGTEDVAGPDLILVHLRQRPHRAQPGRLQKWRGRPAGIKRLMSGFETVLFLMEIFFLGIAVAGGRHPGGPAQSRHLLFEAGRRQRGVLSHQRPGANSPTGKN